MTINYPKLSDRDFLLKYLELYNLLLPTDLRLVPSEIDLIIEFVLLPDDKFNYQRFGTLAKTKVIESAKLRGWKLTGLNINNKLYALIDKNFLRRDEDKVMYLPKHLTQALAQFRQSKTFEVKVLFQNDNSQNNEASK
jgi:hypothetical protein